ncbi:MAG: tRNA (N6-threonylcarbamoyladenosine(37)-N6)-methyltransferase TrmO [Verrucomicrobium sp.]|nr:tRNA (N6-threonylcarbamoyladenosine(37)-N6)-methyltransferase TrmO [Verrucomicrobium sp.]
MEPSLTLRPIGFLRSGKGVRFKTLHQPDEAASETNVLELTPGPGIREALRDLAGMERVWLLWWFHRAESWRPLVLPPRGPSRRRGVFATRSPHRPNPIGMTPARLLGIEGLRLLLGPCDLLEGTPILDLKPYVPAYDAFPGSSAGWIDEVEALQAGPPRFEVAWTDLAREQADWLAATWSVDFRPRLAEILARDPSPHRTRRIRGLAGGACEIGCGGWKAVFRVTGDRVEILRLQPSFPVRFLLESWRRDVPDREAQQAFLARWPCPELELREGCPPRTSRNG